MKNEINVKNFIKILKDSIWEASDSSSYEKYFSQIENLLFGLDDYVIEDLASLEGLTDKSALDIFLRSKTPEEIDRRFYAIHCELRTWAYQRKKQAIEDFYNKKNVKKIIITICLVAFIVLAIIFAIFMSLGNVGIFDIGEKIGVIVAAIGFPFDVISFAAGMLYNLYSDKKRRKIIKTMGSIITDPENEDNQNAEREFLELYKKGYEKESEIKTAITLCGVPESYHKKNLRKARRIFRRLLVANPKDPNLYAGLLRVASKNFTKFQGRQIKKYIKAIYKYNEKNEQLIDDDCNKYIKAYDEHKTQMVAKQRQAEEAAIANGNIRQQRKIQRRKNRREF